VNAMDERTRTLLEQSYETLQRVDALLSEPRPSVENTWTVPPHVRRRVDGGELIYKTTRQEPKAAAMDADTAKAWEQWADGRIRTAVQKALEDFASLMGQEAALQEKRLLKQIEELREDLRAANAKNVTPLRSTHVA